MKDNILEFYVYNFNFLKDLDELNIDFIPSILRRRLSTLDKIALSTLNKVYSNNVQNIVFSSRYGEAERLNKLINQYCDNNEVSPNVFSGSVHNYSSGFYLMNKQNSIPYTAVSACENSISTGLSASVISNYNNNLFCYADFYDKQTNAFAINFTKTFMPKAVKYILNFKNNNFVKDEFDNYVKLFCGEITSLNTPIYTIERAG